MKWFKKNKKGYFKGLFSNLSGYEEFNLPKENFEDVGVTFAKEARKADRGERNHDFYGSATDKEVNDLVDDGIDVFHVPSIKDN